MNEIICPSCKKAFKIDEAGFYLLRININKKPIVSLIRGFKDEIKIIGSKDFVAFLEEENSNN
jgi:hypothetical protein